MKAIETMYSGCLFRSRLEARWAVFLDALRIPWEYEPQGYHVGRQRMAYLPDFWLPTEQLWVEVKGSEDAVDLETLIAAGTPAQGAHEDGLPRNPSGELFTDANRNGPKVLVLSAVPRPSGNEVLLHSVIGFHKGDYYRTFGIWRVVEGGRFGLDMSSYDEGKVFGNDAGDRFDEFMGGAFTDVMRLPQVGQQVHSEVNRAYAAARSARFEHDHRERW